MNANKDFWPKLLQDGKVQMKDSSNYGGKSSVT